VIGPGWLPRYRPRSLVPLSRRTLAFRVRSLSRGPKRSRPSSVGVDRSDDGLYLQLAPAGAEFPIATVRPREASAKLIALVGALQRWLSARWQWLRPRSVPCAVAGLGMFAVLAFSDYLAHYNDGESFKRPAPSHIEVAPR
jgi:hypothetical protein